MTLVFAVLGLLWGVMALLTRVFQDAPDTGPPPVSRTDVGVGRAGVPTEAGTLEALTAERGRVAAIVAGALMANAVPLLMEAPVGPVFEHGRTAPIWVSANRARACNRGSRRAPPRRNSRPVATEGEDRCQPLMSRFRARPITSKSPTPAPRPFRLSWTDSRSRSASWAQRSRRRRSSSPRRPGPPLSRRQLPPPPRIEVALPAAASGALGGSEIIAPMPGTILSVDVKVGQQVDVGQVLCVLEAMKMKNPIRATHAGTIAEICVAAGMTVPYGEVLIRLA